jgi:sugar (pentulose or hexulose) kinase
VLAVDIGTSAVKAGTFDRRGELLAAASVPQAIVGSAWGAREHDPVATWSAFKVAVTSVLGALGKGQELGAAAITGPRGTFCFIDRDGASTSNFITWQDQRAAAVVAADLAGLYDADRYERVVGMGYTSTSVLPKLVWAQRYDAGLVERAFGISTPQGYVLRRLGGGAEVIEPTVAAHVGLLELRTRQWSQDLRDVFGVGDLMLPELVATGDIVGTTSQFAHRELGLPPGLPVVLAGSDGICSEIGLGVTTPGQVYTYLGTASAVAGPIPAKQPRRRLRRTGIVRMPGRDRSLDRLLGLGGAGASAADWAVRTLQIGGMGRLDELAAGSPPGARGVLFAPTLAGASAPNPAPMALGGFVGLSLAHGLEDLARAVLEGVAIELRTMLGAASSLGLQAQELRLTGGGARSPVWRQVIADVFQLPVLTCAGRESGLRGAAISAFAASSGQSLEALAAEWSVGQDVTEPTPALSGRYDRVVANYGAVRKALAGGGVDQALFDTAAWLLQD